MHFSGFSFDFILWVRSAFHSNSLRNIKYPGCYYLGTTWGGAILGSTDVSRLRLSRCPSLHSLESAIGPDNTEAYITPLSIA